jgi:catechol 2,3-dioxygenase-like lactoylglutathione lyase family enzyme
MAVAGIGDKVFVQVCIIVRDVEATAARYVEVFGFSPPRFDTTLLNDHTHATYYGQPTDSRAKLTGFDMGQIQFELLQPLDPRSCWMDHLERHGEGIHHVAFYVPKTEAVVSSFRSHGYVVMQQGLFTGQSGMYTYLDTDKDLGVVIELLEHFGGSPKPHARPQPADRGIGTDVVTQVGLIVRDIEKTARRYVDVLGLPAPQIMVTAGQDVAKTTYRGRPSDAKAKLAFFKLGQLTLELIEPVGEPSVWRDFLSQKGEGAHHIAFDIRETKRVTGHLAKSGIPVAQQGLYSDGSGMYTYVDSQAQLGTTVELLESYARGT